MPHVCNNSSSISIILVDVLFTVTLYRHHLNKAEHGFSTWGQLEEALTAYISVTHVTVSTHVNLVS